MSLFQQSMHLSYVPRWGIVAMHRDQSVAEHSFRTTMIFLKLTEDLRMAVSSVELQRVLLHDSEEAHTGDTPATEKDSHTSDTEPLSDFERALRLADTIEAYTWFRLHGHPLQRQFVVEHVRDRILGTLMGQSPSWYNAVNIVTQEIDPSFSPFSRF